MDQYDLIIFDMDGLMFDTEKIAYISWSEAALAYGYEIGEDLFKQTIGTNLKKTKETYLEHFGNEFPVEAIVRERLRIAEELIKEKGVPVKKGLYELLEFLSNKNIKKAVASSTSKERVYILLKMTSVDSYFDCVLCGDEVVNSKPDPEIFLKVAEKLNCSPSRCIVLEDSEAGILAAHSAGMIPIVIPDMKIPQEQISKLVFKQMSDLLEVKVFFESNNLV